MNSIFPNNAADEANRSRDGSVEASSRLGKEESSSAAVPPAFAGGQTLTAASFRSAIATAAADWLARTSSVHTRIAYAGDLSQFLAFVGLTPDSLDGLTRIRPGDVAAWRDALQSRGQTNATVRRKLTAVRSLFSYL